EQVKVTGSGWLEGEVVELTFTETATDPPGGFVDGPFIFYATAQPDGTISNGDFYPDEHDRGVTFLLTAKGAISGRTAQTTFTDNISGDLDQCANGGVGDPPVPCTGAAWQNGNLNANQAHFVEGDSVPYRIRLDGLAPNTTGHTLTIAFDTTQGNGKHAID